MASKGLLVLALMLAAAVLVATAEQTQANKDETKDAYHGGGGGYGGGGYGGGGYHRGGGCRYGCCSRGYRGCRCCASADEVPEPMYRAEVHN